MSPWFSALSYCPTGSARPVARICRRASSMALANSGNHGIATPRLLARPPRHFRCGVLSCIPTSYSSPSSGPMKALYPQTSRRPAKISRRPARIVGARPRSGPITVPRDIRKLPLARVLWGVSRSVPASYASVKAMGSVPAGAGLSGRTDMPGCWSWAVAVVGAPDAQGGRSWPHRADLDQRGGHVSANAQPGDREAE